MGMLDMSLTRTTLSYLSVRDMTGQVKFGLKQSRKRRLYCNR